LGGKSIKMCIFIKMTSEVCSSMWPCSNSASHVSLVVVGFVRRPLCDTWQATSLSSKRKNKRHHHFLSSRRCHVSTPLATIYQQCSDMLHPTTIDTSGTFVPTIGCGHIWPHSWMCTGMCCIMDCKVNLMLNPPHSWFVWNSRCIPSLKTHPHSPFNSATIYTQGGLFVSPS
jgi:hypothetical protein